MWNDTIVFVLSRYDENFALLLCHSAKNWLDYFFEKMAKILTPWVCSHVVLVLEDDVLALIRTKVYQNISWSNNYPLTVSVKWHRVNQHTLPLSTKICTFRVEYPLTPPDQIKTGIDRKSLRTKRSLPFFDGQTSCDFELNIHLTYFDNWDLSISRNQFSICLRQYLIDVYLA